MDAEAASVRLLDETIAFWEPRAGCKLTREDARQIRENLTGFFRTLLEWEAKRELGEETPDRASVPTNRAA